MVAKYFLQKRGLEITTFTRKDIGTFDSKTLQRDVDMLYAEYQRLFQEIGSVL